MVMVVQGNDVRCALRCTIPSAMWWTMRDATDDAVRDATRDARSYAPR